MQQIYVYFHQVKNNWRLTILVEILWLMIAAITMLVVYHLVADYISTSYLTYLFCVIFLSVLLFRVSLFLHSIPWMKSFWPRILVIFICVPGIFVVLNFKQVYFEAFENYNYNGIGYAEDFILRYTSYENLSLIKMITQIFSTACMFLMALAPLRLAFGIFKKGQVPWVKR